MRRPPPSLRHITAHRLAFAAVALTVLFTTVCAATVASFASAVTSVAVRRSLSTAAGNAILVSAQTSATGSGQAGELMTAAIRSASGGLPMTFTKSIQSPYLNLPATSRGGPQPLAQIISLPGLNRRASLLTGQWPAGPAGQAGGPVPVCVPAGAAMALRLAVGDTLTLRDIASGQTIAVRVSCTFRRDQPASPYWSLSPLGAAGIQHAGTSTVYGPLVTSPALAGGRMPVGSAVLLAQPDFSRLRAANLASLSGRLSAADATLANSAALGGASVATQLPGLLGNLATALVVARSQLLIGVLILLVIAGATVTVAVRLLALQREPEAALLAARGASRRQLAARGVTDALLLAVPAGLASPFIASWLVPLMAHGGSLASAGLRLNPGEPASAWLASAAVAAGCGVIIALPWLRQPPSPVRQRVQRGRQRAIGAAVSGGADLALILLAAIAAWQLAHFSALVTTGIGGQLGVDPILVGAPVLALAAGTLVLLRLLPLAARLGDTVARRSRGLTAAVATWQISRRPLHQAGPALLAVLAVATAVVTLAENSSWQHSVQDQARFAIGADVRVTLPPDGSLAVGQVAGITAARGVRASTPAVRVRFALPDGSNATLLALDPRSAADVIALRTQLGTSSLASQLARLDSTGPAPGAALPGRPARLRIAARLSAPGITAPALFAELTDAAGVGYQVPAGSLPADGHSHQLTVTIAAGHQADYPLRLTGFAIEYTQVAANPAAATLEIESASTAAGTQGSFAAPLPLAARAGWLVPGQSALYTPGLAAPRAVADTLTATLTTAGTQGTGPIPASFSVMAAPAVAALPALATSGFLAASGTRVGGVVTAEVQGTAIPVRLAGEVSRFPTVTGPGGGLVVDQAALQDALRALGLPPAPATEWWLRTSGNPALAALPPGSSVASSAALARSLSAQPLSTAPLLALLLIAAAAVILACGGFVVSVLARRDRERDVAMLDALGARPGQLLRLLCLEQALVAVPAAAAGLLLGVLLSLLIVPAVSLTAQATRPDPPVIVQVPWTAVIAITVIIAAGPALAAAVAGARRAAAAAMLRMEEET